MKTLMYMVLFKIKYSLRKFMADVNFFQIIFIFPDLLWLISFKKLVSKDYKTTKYKLKKKIVSIQHYQCNYLCIVY